MNLRYHVSETRSGVVSKDFSEVPTPRLTRGGSRWSRRGYRGPDARYVVRTASVRSSPIGDDYWSVLVGAEVLYRTEAGFVPGGLEYYEVAVADVDAGMIATAPPLPAAAPVVPVPKKGSSTTSPFSVVESSTR